MKRGKTYDWIPLWRDKWLQGSTRFELLPDERSVFIDLLCMAGGDDGFIRANPETPYPDRYLANLLNIDIELWERTVRKCVSVGKIIRMEDGILYVASWQEYRIPARTKRWLMDETPTAPRTEHQSPNPESLEEGQERRDNTLDLDEYRNPPLVPGNDCRVPGKKEESDLDRAIERERHKAVILTARAAAGRKGMKARWEKYNKMADNKTDNKITNDNKADNKTDNKTGDSDEESADEQAELDARLEAREREEREL
ncbi:MAG: hypothetical protein ABSG73_13850 [Candidatus Aminicenantales bacterium]|jgi:hypothetical protein